ncbi:MAG: lysoplasmalogenase [Desulfobacterales bacterium]|nr:lysoplasmalogenase [Desulfobacterales bacterium]
MLIVVFAAGLLAGLLYCEKKEALKAKLVVKTALSFLFIFTAVVQPHPIFPYYRFLLIGMILCLGGDVFLALPAKKMFLYGLVSFLLGHVFYVAAFFYTAGINQWTGAGLAINAMASGGVFLWLRPHLGSMKFPVIFYILVITAMVLGAWSVVAAGELTLSGRMLVFIGALSFYFSDIFVARQRFLKAEFVNRLMGLPLYYGGQFLLAFSVGLLKPAAM